VNEAHFAEIERALLYISEARERAERTARELERTGADAHLIRALEEHSLSGLLDFTEKDGLVAGGVEAHLDTADTREQSDYRERS
jgi:predicted methyltransferase MtxX (methanogen marker protein 4)